MLGYHIRIAFNKSQASHSQSDNVIVPESIFQTLPSHSKLPRSQGREDTFESGTDYRLGPISIDWMDIDQSSDVQQRKTSVSGKERQRQPTRGTATASFIERSRSKCGTTYLPEGVVHVYRDSAPPHTVRDQEFPALPSSAIGNADVDGVMLGVLAVPSWMNPSDFLAFVAPAADGITHLRMIRDSAPNRSITVIKFRKASDAAEFAEAYNGKAFNSMEPEICHVVHVSSVIIDPEDSTSVAISRLAEGSAYELPTCPVCLERMDSAVTGLVTVPCSHTFHCSCLSKWGDSRCPVCRYSQTLLSSHPVSSTSRRPAPFTPPSTSTSTCFDCASTTNLWICLICGNIGCGRYGRAHAQAHYQRTTHLYALELETQRVWDYAGDGYVHRLIQNKADGKLVELPSASMSGAAMRDGSASGAGPGPADALSAEKIEAIGIEYSYLLTSQLDSQREYYESQKSAQVREMADMRRAMEELRGDLDRLRTNFADEERRRREEEEERLGAIEREKERAERKLDKVSELARRLDRELKEEKAVTSGLMGNISRLKDQLRDAEEEKVALKAQITELEDQLRDVMFFLDAKTKIEESEGIGAEMAGGSIELAPSTPSRSNAKKKGKQKK
ncbi:zf-UBP-domain-containing protein [Punctularia strigosozonata HHB-11173 SS5]|uniref:Zf-UBP-domain-containing protein n=1 Tax=Punctularia strigosozonata (strain HHB-11173) TaxID=741275 RepID=R7S3L0_PUNST|nr:zf-UBP-domain-containing protein [Punctularia strigosozonata HHB-11173 SS5]EIN03806.1 zf-UBP-domain-containing protein [Punctularia strigosozonata HHB-11173 SS5]